MISISFEQSQNKPVETQTSLADGLFTFIENSDSKARLEAQIKRYEEDLKYLSDLIDFFDNLGYEEMSEDAVRRYNTRNEKILLLQLEVNKLDRQMLEFELEAIRRK